MKKKNKTVKSGLALLCMLLLTGCGGAGADKSMSQEAVAVDTYATDNLYMSETAMEAEEAGGASEISVKDETRKLIRTVGMNVETEEFDTLMQNVTQKVEDIGGYVENSSIYNGSHYNGDRSRSADLVLRIPSEKLDEFLSVVSEISNVTSRNENVTDVTLQYVDMKSHKEALEVEKQRLMELLSQAENVDDIIIIESRLSDVRYQIESMESQLRTMEHQVSYSTVSLYINEVKRLTPAQQLTTWEKIRTGFAESLYRVGEGIKNFFIGLIIYLPYLAVWAVVITVIVMVIKGIRKIKKKSRAARQEKGLSENVRKESESSKEEPEGNREESENRGK